MSKLKKAESGLLFLTLLFLPTQLGKHFWPQFSYIYSLKIDYLSPVFYFWDALLLGLLAVWFLAKPKLNMSALNIFLFFLFTQVLSLLGSSNIEAGLVRLEQYILAGFFGVYLASQDFKSLSKKIYLPLALGILGESFIAILQFTRGSTLGLWILGERTFTLSSPGIAKFDFYGREFLRPYGTFPHPNVLAAFILIGAYIMHQASVERQRVIKLALILSGITVFLTMSRAVILAGFITLAVLLKKKWLIVIIIITIILSPVLFTRFFAIFNFDNLTFLRREELSVSALKMFLKAPLFGIGLNNFIPTLASDLVTGPSRFLQPVHNIFLLALSETGLIGLIGLISLIGYPIIKSAKCKAQSVKLVPWIIIIFLGMFDHYFLTLPQGYRLLFLVWGLSFSMIK